MNALSFLLILVVAVLSIALVAARRRLAASRSRQGLDPAEQPADSRAQAIEAAATRAPVGIVVVDQAGNEVFKNDVAALATAATADDALLGLRLRGLLDEARDFDEDIEQQIELFSPTTRTIQLQAMPLFSAGQRAGTAGFIEDLTTRSEIDSMRSDFIANASHELKTPLGAMRLLAEALVTTDDNDTRKDLAEKINAEAGRMNRLVEDILDLALIEHSPAETQEIDLCRVAEEALAKSASLAEALGIAVDHSCDPVIVAGDHRRLVSAIANLVENALTYTAAKGLAQNPPVQLRILAQGERAIIEVQDQGIGIPERHQDRIFERFYRVDRGRSRASGGTGLGLAIVRHVVQNHSGEVEVASVPWEGTTFRIILPALED